MTPRMTVRRSTNYGNVDVMMSETELKALVDFATLMLPEDEGAAERVAEVARTLAPEHRAPLARIKAKALKGLEMLTADKKR